MAADVAEGAVAGTGEDLAAKAAEELDALGIRGHWREKLGFWEEGEETRVL